MLRYSFNVQEWMSVNSIRPAENPVELNTLTILDHINKRGSEPTRRIIFIWEIILCRKKKTTNI